MNERIGELLVKENLLSSEQLLKAREEAATQGKRLGAQITALGFMDENELTEFVAKQYGVPSINLEDFQIEPEVLALIPEEVANKHSVVPVNRAGSTLILATADPSNIFALDDISSSRDTTSNRSLRPRMRFAPRSRCTTPSRKKICSTM